MAFEFIDNGGTIDRRQRRLIRSQAAKGKNIGKIRRPRARPPARQSVRVLLPPRGHRAGAAETGTEHGNQSPYLPLVNIAPLEPAMSVRASHGALNTSSARLVRRRQPAPISSTSLEVFADDPAVFRFLSMPLPKLSHAIDFDFSISSSLWIQYLFVHEIYFHGTLAMIAAIAENLPGQPGSSEEAVHLACCLRMLNERLSGDEATSNATIAAIVSLGHYERLSGRTRQSLVHFTALKRIIELRGGIFCLVNECPGIAQKVFRTDLEYALYSGSDTHFNTWHVPGHTAITMLRASLSQDHRHKVCRSAAFRQLSPELQDIFLDVVSLAHQLSRSPDGGEKMSLKTFHDLLILLGYRLVQVSPLGAQRPARHLDNIVHVGLLAFMVAFLVDINGKLPEFNLLSELARSAAQADYTGDRACLEPLLWVLLVGRTTIFEEFDDAWLIPTMRKTTEALGIRTWDDLIQSVSIFPWVQGLHNHPGHVLWRNVSPNSEDWATFPIRGLRSLTASNA